MPRTGSPYTRAYEAERRALIIKACPVICAWCVRERSPTAQTTILL